MDRIHRHSDKAWRTQRQEVSGMGAFHWAATAVAGRTLTSAPMSCSARGSCAAAGPRASWPAK
ncbi:hypothetical protein SGPA1_11462 [Streptomyces misionensis JCM 4497]